MFDLKIDMKIDLGFGDKKQERILEPPFPIHTQQQENILDPFEEWLNSDSKRGMFLGFRKCGKTDLITIYSISKWIQEDTSRTVIIMTRKQDRARAIVRKIGDNLKSVGISGEFGQDQIRLTHNKQPTVLALTVNSTTKGWHSDLLIMDDPVEPSDEYSLALKRRVDLVFEECKNISNRVYVIGQYVSRDDIYVKLQHAVQLSSFWIDEATQDLIDILELDIQDLKKNLPVYGKNYEGVFYPDDSAPFSDFIMGDYGSSWDYGLVDPSNGKNDYSAFVYLKDFGEFVAVKGVMHKTDWITSMEKELVQIKQLKKFYYEENTIGASGWYFFKEKGIKAYSFFSVRNKVEKILSLLPYFSDNRIRFDNSSDPVFISTIQNWSTKGGNNQVDDGIDALSMIIERLGIFRKTQSLTF